MSFTTLVCLCVASAAFYVLATAVLKLAGGTPFLILLLPVCAMLGLAAWFESMALPGARLGIVLILILAFEVLLTAACSLALGERYTGREIGGLLAILIGLAVLFDAEGSRHEAARAAGR